MASKFNWSTFSLALILICLPAVSVSQAAVCYPINVFFLGLTSFEEDDDDHEKHEREEYGDKEYDHEKYEYIKDDYAYDQYTEKLAKHKMKLAIAAAEMKLEAMEVGLEFKHLEHEEAYLKRVFRLTEDEQKMSFFAIMQINEFMDEEDAVPFLKSCLESAEDEQIKRTIRWKLVELSSELDNEDVLKEQLKSLIIGK